MRRKSKIMWLFKGSVQSINQRVDIDRIKAPNLMPNFGAAEEAHARIRR